MHLKFESINWNNPKLKSIDRNEVKYFDLGRRMINIIVLSYMLIYYYETWCVRILWSKFKWLLSQRCDVSHIIHMSHRTWNYNSRKECVLRTIHTITHSISIEKYAYEIKLNGIIVIWNLIAVIFYFSFMSYFWIIQIPTIWQKLCDEKYSHLWFFQCVRIYPF